MIDRHDLARVLSRRNLADWVVIERDQQRAHIDEAAPGLRRGERRTRWELTVHSDTPLGRGSAHVSIDALDGDPDKLVDEAVAIANAAVGPAWTSSPPSAPARVALADPAIAGKDPIEVADAVLHLVPRPDRATITGAAVVLREHVSVLARQGFHTEWDATLMRVELLVVVGAGAAGARSLVVEREARRVADLDLSAAVTQAVADLQALASARPPVGGPCQLVLAADALLHDGLGVWAAFVSQADPVVARRGLTRYHEHTAVAAGADQQLEPLTIASDGALAFGVQSAPLGDAGDAVRKFTLVDRGVAVGLGLSPREAALRRRDPNGGVRNLVVAIGTWPGAIDGMNHRVVEVKRLRDLAIDPYTGDASCEIALGIDHGPKGAIPFTGGTIRLDLIAALTRARRSASRLRRGPYDGPDSVLIEDVDLIA